MQSIHGCPIEKITTGIRELGVDVEVTKPLPIGESGDGSQLAEIGELLKVGIIRPVINKVFPFGQSRLEVYPQSRGACSESTFQQKLQQNHGGQYWRMVAYRD